MVATTVTTAVVTKAGVKKLKTNNGAHTSVEQNSWGEQKEENGQLAAKLQEDIS